MENKELEAKFEALLLEVEKMSALIEHLVMPEFPWSHEHQSCPVCTKERIARELSTAFSNGIIKGKRGE